MSAVLSDCGRYRYALDRSGWLGGTGSVLFVMLNPSTADAEHDDPTIRRCIRFAQDWGYARLSVANLYAYRATKPADLTPLGPAAIGEETSRGSVGHIARYGPIYRNHNDDWIRRLTMTADRVIVAWGANAGPVPGRANEVADLIAVHGGCSYALGVTKDGHPRHPLYVRADAELIDWSPPQLVAA